MRLFQILLNLLSNAIKFSNENDDVFVICKYFKKDIQISSKTFTVQIEVVDTGIGITEVD